MKLELHLIPHSAWGHNLRKIMSPYKWRKLSKEIRELNDWSCQICEYKSKTGKDLHLHEVWKFNDETRIQLLTGFESVCVFCHDVHHWGRSSHIYGHARVMTLMTHACKVNQVDRLVFEQHIKRAGEEWHRRSQTKWTLDLGDWKSTIKGE